MASKVCTICGKKSEMGGYYVKLRGKFNPTKKKRRYPNLQWTRLPAPASAYPRAGGQAGLISGKRVLACAKCIKSFSKI